MAACDYRRWYGRDEPPPQRRELRARAAGHEIDAEERVEAIDALLARAGPGGKASMLQDVEAGRRTEIDVVTGAVVREAEAHGIGAPLNRALLALVRGYERANALA